MWFAKGVAPVLKGSERSRQHKTLCRKSVWLILTWDRTKRTSRFAWCNPSSGKF